MPRVSRPWFRVYVEMFGDRKIKRLTPTQRWIWCAVLSAARESPEPGRLFIAPGVPMTFAELADYADVKHREIAPAVALMVGLGMVAERDGVLEASNFGDRQYESDDVTRRTRAHRERSKEQPTEQGRNVPKNVRRNTPETETETETEKNTCSTESSTSPTRKEPDRFDEFYAAFPKHVARRAAANKFASLVKQGCDPQSMISGAERYATEMRGVDAQFVKQPDGWLNAGRWDDEPARASASRADPYAVTPIWDA